MPELYPEDFRHEVFDLVAAGHPIWPSGTRRFTPGDNQNSSTQVNYLPATAASTPN